MKIKSLYHNIVQRCVAKDIWTMTFGEFLDLPKNKRKYLVVLSTRYVQAVSNAMAEGKPVPMEVIASHTELVKISGLCCCPHRGINTGCRLHGVQSGYGESNKDHSEPTEDGYAGRVRLGQARAKSISEHPLLPQSKSSKR